MARGLLRCAQARLDELFSVSLLGFKNGQLFFAGNFHPPSASFLDCVLCASPFVGRCLETARETWKLLPYRDNRKTRRYHAGSKITFQKS